MVRVAAYQYGIYPRSENVVAATRGLERGRTGPEEVADAFRADREDFVGAQSEAGLDYFSDGLLRWQDIFRPLVESAAGLEARTLVRWFDNNSFFRAPEATGDVALAKHVPEVYLDDDDIPAPRVATLPSPYLFSRAAQHSGDRNALMMELTRELLAPVVRNLAGRGYEIVHLQEPWLVYFGIDDADWDELEKSLTEIREAAPEGTTYFGDAGRYADRLRRLPVDVVGVDLVETDPASLGTNWTTGLLAGCLDGRSSTVESAETTSAFITQVAERTGVPSLFVSSSSELELLPRDVARDKVLQLGQVAAGVREALS
jgi:5-methyltetrahydropteroyltriglutamate--homocysteine methyltransferase